MTKEERAAKKWEWNEYRERRIQILIRNLAIIRSKVCPLCGCGIHRNLSLSGWWQCNASGTEQYRVGDGIGKPHCNFDCFYDPTPQDIEELVRRGAIEVDA